MRGNSRRLLLALTVPVMVMLAATGCGNKQEPAQQASAPTNSQVSTSSDSGYVGDQACKQCHTSVVDTWGGTSHGSFVKDMTKDPKAFIGELSGNYPKMVGFKAEDIQYILLGKPGMLKTQEFVGKKGQFGVPADDYPVLWSSWNAGEKKWEIEVEAMGEGTPWLGTCAGCHVYGLKVPTQKTPTTARSFAGFGISCEQCHGPGAKHVKNPKENPMIISLSADNCGQCHTRGKSTAKTPDGKSFGYPYNDTQGQYTPDQKLSDFYTWETPESDKAGKAFWPDKHVKNSHHLQYPEWLLTGHAKSLATLKANPGANPACLKCHSAEGYLAKAGQQVALTDAKNSVTCQVCHASHDPKAGAAFLRKPKKEICSQCHNGEGGIAVGKQIHHPQKEMNEGTIGLGFPVSPSVMEKAGVTCVDCHMPYTSGPKPSHLMKVAMPKDGKKFGMPDSCSSCHPSASQDYLQASIDKWQGDVTKKLAEVKAQLAAKKANAATQQYKEALTYSQIVEADGSKGVHNYDLAMKLLNTASAKLK